MGHDSFVSIRDRFNVGDSPASRAQSFVHPQHERCGSIRCLGVERDHILSVGPEPQRIWLQPVGTEWIRVRRLGFGRRSTAVDDGREAAKELCDACEKSCAGRRDREACEARCNCKSF